MTKETKEFQESYLKAVTSAKNLGIDETIAEIAKKGSQNITTLKNPEQDRGIMEKGLYVKVFSAVENIESEDERDAFLQGAKNGNIATGDFKAVSNSLLKNGKQGVDTFWEKEFERLENSPPNKDEIKEVEFINMTPIENTNQPKPNTNQKIEAEFSNEQSEETSLTEKLQQLRNKGKAPPSNQPPQNNPGGQDLPKNSHVGQGIPSGDNHGSKLEESKKIQPPSMLSEQNKNLKKEVEEIQKKNEEIKKEPPLKPLDMHKENDLESDEKKKKSVEKGISITLDTAPPSDKSDKKDLADILGKYAFDFEGKKHEASVQKNQGKDGEYSVNISPLTPGKEAEAMKAMFENMGIKPAPEPQLVNGVRVYDLNAEQSKIFHEKTGIKEPEKGQDKTLDKEKHENKETDKSKQPDKSLEKDKEKQPENKGPNFSSSNHTGMGGGNKSGFSSFSGNKPNINFEHSDEVKKQSTPNSKTPGTNKGPSLNN